MSEDKKVYILIENSVYAGDGMRSALGLAVENHYGYAVLFDGEFPRFSDYVKDNIDFLREMEGDALTVGADTPKNVELTSMTVEELGEKMRDADFIIPYGLPKQTAKQPDCA